MSQQRTSLPSSTPESSWSYLERVNGPFKGSPGRMDEWDAPAGSMLASAQLRDDFVESIRTDDDTAAADYEAITAAVDTLDQRYVPLGPIPSRLATNR